MTLQQTFLPHLHDVREFTIRVAERAGRDTVVTIAASAGSGWNTSKSFTICFDDVAALEAIPEEARKLAVAYLYGGNIVDDALAMVMNLKRVRRRQVGRLTTPKVIR